MAYGKCNRRSTRSVRFVPFLNSFSVLWQRWTIWNSIPRLGGFLFATSTASVQSDPRQNAKCKMKTAGRHPPQVASNMRKVNETRRDSLFSREHTHTRLECLQTCRKSTGPGKIPLFRGEHTYTFHLNLWSHQGGNNLPKSLHPSYSYLQTGYFWQDLSFHCPPPGKVASS